MAHNHNILLATDVDLSEKNIIARAKEQLVLHNRNRVKKEVKQLKSSGVTVDKDKQQQLIDMYANDDESIEMFEHFKYAVFTELANHNVMRKTIHNLNELSLFSGVVERFDIQRIPENNGNLLEYDVLINQGISNKLLMPSCMHLYSKTYDQIRQYVSRNHLDIEIDDISLLVKIFGMYTINKNFDDLELYERYDLKSNLDFANQLAILYFRNDQGYENILNAFAHRTTAISSFTTTRIISNKLLATLLMNGSGDDTWTIPEYDTTGALVYCDAISPLVSNNAVSCFESTYTTDSSNMMVYATRTIGELLLMITNESRMGIAKEDREQIYMTYCGIRPTSNEYHYWNGLQVYDIDLKPWDGSVYDFKEVLYSYLVEFNWFLWVCVSASGRGIHIYTKVAPPHHNNIVLVDNEQVAKYWYMANYANKLATIYDIIWRIQTDSATSVKFKSTDFEEKELRFMDNTVGRITSGIRLTYDAKPLVNPNFVDMHPGLNLIQTVQGFADMSSISSTILRPTKLNIKLIDRIDELTMPIEKDESADLSQYVTMCNDSSEFQALDRSGINYTSRYNVCNTLASLMGKDGLAIAHTILQSKQCKNVDEINSFYSCAISNNKKPSKLGIEILKKHGIIKSVADELKDELTVGFKYDIKRSIERSLKNKVLSNTIELAHDEYIGDKIDMLTNPDLQSCITNDKINILLAPPGTGKCLGFNTEILMFDCSTKKVQDIVVGDLLMGWDSKPRKVLSTCTGQENMYKIVPKHGNPWECNESHILSVIESGMYKETGGAIPSASVIQDIDINGIRGLSKNHRKKLFRVPLSFEKKEVLISPYWLGMWLGDGNMNDCQIAVGDIDIAVQLPFLEGYANKLGCTVTRYEDKRENHNISTYNIVSKHTKESPLKDMLRSYNLIRNKHIPKEYLYNDRRTRLFLFAGLIDSDGGGDDGTYDYVTKLDSLRDDICFLARSLGYYVNCNPKIINGTTYWRLLISGDFSDVPVRLSRKKFIRKINKNPLMTGFEIEPLGMGTYYGFEIDGDKRFMLGDFTVTHNTEFIKSLARQGKRIMLVLPYISVIQNKIENEPEILSMFECYYGSKDIKDLEYGVNAVTTFDKFSKANYEKISKMFDYIMIDESHLLFTSSYRIEATSKTIRKIKDLYYISSNDPFAAKICLLTGTETGESYFFGNIANIIRISKKSLTKTMEFIICDDILDSVTRVAYKAHLLITDGYKILIPTNKGEIYSEKIIGMIEYLLGRTVKYGYYKRSNTEQEICKLINEKNTVGDYDIVFCSNYLSVGVDINDGGRFNRNVKFASIYLGPFAGYEIEQFNARIRKTGIKSIYCIQTQKSDGTILEALVNEPNLILQLTQEDVNNFSDDKAISTAKQNFIAQYDPVLHNISTPGFGYLNGKIQFNLEEYELISFENKYGECMQHPVKVARELARYGYDVTVSTEFDGLGESIQKELKRIGIEAAKQEKTRKHSLLVGTFIELVEKNTYVNEHGLEFTDIVGWIGKNPDLITEDRDMESYIEIKFDLFASPTSVIVKNKEALNAMYKSAKYLLSKYSVSKILDIINSFVGDDGILKQKQFQRSLNLLRLVENADANELSESLNMMLTKIYDFVDQFDSNPDFKMGYNAYMSTLDTWTNDYVDSLGIRLNTLYAYDKVKDVVIELLSDIATKSHSKAGISFRYNKLPDQNSNNVTNRRSVDVMIKNMFKITESETPTTASKSRDKHITLTTIKF